ncbi:MAG: branched-chain amino acid ABC transporter permease [Candidatus Berkelbacteria bacterium]|nr:branched-chain amino acid ABC transporter permease [Candidatus Berkelbacteria bacterium]MCR4307307.1 branched-chain amino acid ABC transporter permease [Candidatus Berkelbacteria bacterium]
MISGYFVHLLIIISIYLILALSLQLSVGFTGLLNLGHIAFYAIGAYASALLAKAGMPFWLCILAAGLLPMVFAYVLSLATSKLKGDYFALATLGFSFVIYSLALNWTNVTNGPLGLPQIPKPQILGIDFSSNINFLFLAITLAIVTYLVINMITISPFGKTLEAIRDDELAAKTLGKNTSMSKSVSLVISSFFAGVAGSLFAYYLTYIDPSSFAFGNLIPIVVITVVGGLASLPGTIFATIIIVLLPEPLRFLGLPSSLIGPGRQALYAIFLLLILLFKPKGFYGKVDLE